MRKLTEIIGVKYLDEDIRNEIVKRHGFISEYKLLEAGLPVKDNLVTCLEYGAFEGLIARSYSGQYYQVRSAFRKEAIEMDDSEFAEVNDLYISVIENHAPNPTETFFEAFLTSYVKLLRAFQPRSETAGFISRSILPQFNTSVTYLDKEDACRLLDGYPTERIKNSDKVSISMFKKEGISHGQAKRYIQFVESLDKYRTKLHTELRELGSKLELSETDLMSQIVFNFHRCCREMEWKEREVVISAGIVLCSAYDSRFAVDINEGPLTPSATSDPHSMETISSRKAQADRLAKALNEQPERFLSERAAYTSNILGSEEEDMAVFSILKETHPEIPIEYGYNPSHVSHGKLVCHLKLTADLSQLFEQPKPDISFSAFMESIENAKERVKNNQAPERESV